MASTNAATDRQSQIVKTVCNMCTNHCGINVYVENGKIVKTEGMSEHPYHYLCIKPSALSEMVHSKERLTAPLKKVNGKFKEVSWDEAFAFLADKLDNIKKKYGAKAVNIYVGNPFIATQTEKVIRRWADVYGTPNYTTGARFCFIPKVIGHSLTVGGMILPYVSNGTKCIVIWGKNPQETFASEINKINRLLKEGAKLIVVDPRRTPLAKRADFHAQVRPGTDCALALGLLNVIISEGLYDKEFVKDWTLGFDKFAEYVKEFTPKRVEEITWVPAATVEKIARLYATTKPACTSLGVSMDHCTNGIQAIRAISVMVAITGNLDVPGGSVIDPGGLAQTNLRLEDRVAGETPIGADYPIYTKYIRETVLTHLIDAILDGKPYPVKGLLVAGSNLAVTWPDSSRVRKALEKLDLLAVIDIFMNDTAKIADIVLPATTFGEREDIRDAYHNHEDLCVFVRTNRVIEPIGNSMEDWKIWAELGRRMGYAEYFPWKDTEELHRELLKPSGITLEQLKQNPGGIIYREKKFQQYLKDGFNTPSKKVEIYSEAMDKLGIDPIPTFREPLESPISRPDLAKKYPLTLTTGSRLAPYLHSEYRNLPSLKKLLPEPFIEINPETASKLGIANGDMVKVESPRGSIKIKAKLTDDVHSNVVSIQMGWAEANANFLTSNTTSDPVLGIAGLRSVLCRVIKAR